MTPVKSGTRAVGDSIRVFDTLGGHARELYTGTISNITKRFVTVKHPLGSETRFHRATGYVVGYSFPGIMDAVAPETSK